MAEPHVDRDQAGEVRWFSGHGPREVQGPCPHDQCPHDSQAVIAWGPDYRRYELLACHVPDGCDGICRAWSDGSVRTTSPWLQVALPRRHPPQP